MSLQGNDDEMSLQGEDNHNDDAENREHDVEDQEQEEHDFNTLNDYVSSYVFDSIASSLK
jgi:hypothetical protein